jgi:hypothetical protein
MVAGRLVSWPFKHSETAQEMMRGEAEGQHSGGSEQAQAERHPLSRAQGIGEGHEPRQDR